MKAEVTMRNGNEQAVIKFTKDYKVIVEHDNIERGNHSRSFTNFDEARNFFLQMVGALYMDGYR